MVELPDDPDARVPVNVLLVDDHMDNRVALRGILSSPSYRVVEASSGAEALRRLLDDEFAVLLLDVVMPGLSGFELASTIRQRESAATVPIIFLSAQAVDADYIYKGYRAGAVDYLLKPLIPEMVRAKVAVFAELYRQRKRIERQGALLLEAERKERRLGLIELQLSSERRYHLLADAVPNIVWTSGPDGKVDYFNQRWFEYTGLSVEQTGLSWDAALHPDDTSRCRAALEKAIAGVARCELEVRLRAADGSFRWHLGRAVPEQGVSGQLIAWIGTFTDIEEQKRNHAALAEFKGTLDAVLDAVFMFESDDWRFLYTNHGATALLGYSQEELSKMRPVDFLADQDDEGFREILAPLTDGAKTSVQVDMSFRRKDGSAVPVAVSLQCIPIDGNRVVAIARDITERKRAELQRELLYRESIDALHARDEFLSVASHELRTPLSSLQLQIEMLVRPPRPGSQMALSPEQVTAKLQVAARQVHRLSRLVTELMDVSRIAAGRLRVEFEPVDLAELVSDVVTRFSEDAARAHSEVTLSAPEPVVGRWDRLRIEQVVTNLLTNALKFGSGRPIQIAVEQMGDDRARLMVRDHGIGVDPEDVERIFERFERAVSASRIGGLGLGLYIARQIVDAHGGTIGLESESGAGSTFTVVLPRDPPALAEAEHRNEHPNPHH